VVQSENMPRILLIKLTSLGDVIHVLPAITDAYRHDPSTLFDWVIDSNFSEVATWHPAIEQIIPTNHRRWRKEPFSSSTRSELFKLTHQLRSRRYDLIIDGQGNFKSALLALLAKGKTCGYDRDSIREWVAHLAYQETYSVSWKSHAIDRLRQLFAAALNYPLPTTKPDFSLLKERFKQPQIDLPSSYLIFIPNAAWETKLWPEEHWISLIEMLEETPILLPWGNERERQRAVRLSEGRPHVTVLPKLSLSELGFVLSRAKAAVSMDTGLSHLASALEVPSVTLYGATDSGMIGTCGKNQLQIQSQIACAPCHKKKCLYPSSTLPPPCLGSITPQSVFEKLHSLQTRLSVLTGAEH
jgi:heptosyltransferase I